MVKEVEDGLKHKGIVVNFSDNLRITGLFGNGLEDIHARGIKIPKEIKASDTFPDGSVAFDDSFDGTILVNKKYNWKQAKVNDVYRLIGQNLGTEGTYAPTAGDWEYLRRVAGLEVVNDKTAKEFKGFVFDKLISGTDNELEPRARELYKKLGGVFA